VKAIPSKTINKLHFSDLDPIRFEDFCLSLLYPLHPWEDIRHYGRVGSDGGVDIYAVEKLENDLKRVWFIQCRRYKSATNAVLKKAVDDSINKLNELPEVLLIVVASDVRRKSHEYFIEYAKKKGVNTPLLWTASILEAKLYSERRDLLFSYFGISDIQKARGREVSISRNISIKKRLHKDLLKTPKDVDWEKARNNPVYRFNYSEAIIHSIDDDSYPGLNENRSGISGWFKLELWDFYHNGLDFVINIDEGIIDKKGNWATIKYNHKYDEKKFKKIKMFRIARIPFRNIVEYDTLGDEFYPGLHLYCRYADGGEPYEAFRWILIGNDYPWPMPQEKQFNYNGVL